jgi:DNA invertase Pin-like site-specific DNA recombinase
MQDLEHQRQAVTKYIAAQGYGDHILLEFEDEAQSGAKGEASRPGYAALLKAIKGRTIDKVILFEGSRISRDYMSYLRFMELATANGVQVEIVGKGVQGFSSPQEMLLASIQGFMAAAERDNISKRIKSGIAASKAAGNPFGCPKGERRKLGYRKQYSKELLDEVRKWTAQGHSCRAIADLLGTRFTQRPLSPMTINRIQRR